MERNYIILIVIAIGLAIGILFMDKTEQPSDTDPATLAVSWNDPSRFLSVDEVTKRIIQNDPGIMLIDIRPETQFNSYSIPGAINIPMDSLLTDGSQDVLTIPGIDKVLYSNSEVWSDQAWLICKRMKNNSVFILQGGINEWFDKIVNVKEPSVTAPQEEMDRYSFRIGARQYFYGSKGEAKITEKKPINVIPVKRVQSTVPAAGGC